MSSSPAKIVAGAIVAIAVLIVLAVGFRRSQHRAWPRPAIPSTSSPAGEPTKNPAAIDAPGFLYGRITTTTGDVYEGRLRFGGDQEAFWSDSFNGFKVDNPWAALVALERLPRESHPLAIFGIEIAQRERVVALGRPFMVRLGDLARIDVEGRHVRVLLKSGTVFDLDRFESSDFDDGVRVWDATRGAVDVISKRIRAIELLPTPALTGVPARLHGTVHTAHEDFTGLLEWNRQASLGSDELEGRTDDSVISLRFDTIRSIARRGADASPGAARPVSAQVTLVDGREIALSNWGSIGRDNRGLYVDDRRYGRVLVPWDAFERVDFAPGDSGPAYSDFPPGRALTGSVTTRSGKLLAGRLVFDLDESETTETLDAPAGGVDYIIPLGLVASIQLPGGEEAAARARVMLHDGEELQLERSGDLGKGNAGVLIFVDGAQHPEYMPWPDVARIDFDRPPASPS